MTRDDLITAAPWIAFGIGLSAIGIRLLRTRRAGGPGPGKRWPGPAGSGAADPAEPDSRQETIGSPETQEGQCPQKNTEARPR